MLLKSDFDFQQTEAGLLNKGSYLARALGVTKFTNIKGIILDFDDVQQAHLWPQQYKANF